MDLLEAIRTRRSVRQYTGDPIPREHLETIVDAGRLAASGNNRQPWEFIVVTDPAQMARLRVPADHWSARAAAMVAVVLDGESRWWVEDGAAAVQNMLLAAHGLGYGGCWIEGYTRRNEDVLREALCIPPERQLFTLVVLGVPGERPQKEKKALEEVIHWQVYGH